MDDEVNDVLNEVQRLQPGDVDGPLIQEKIDWLDESLGAIDPTSALYVRVIGRLRTLCRRSGRLPTACQMTGAITLENETPLHRTGFSDVYRGRWKGKIVALKSLRIHVENSAMVTRSFHDEVITWSSVRHPNIVPFLGVTEILPVCLVSEWMTFGSIATFLRARPGDHRVKYITDILNGLLHMHTIGVVHGDLKAANILVNSSMTACLADFGLTALLQSSSTITTGTASTRGTLRWMSPELLDDRSGPGSGRPTKASDMYAVATVIWEIFSGRLPYEEVPSEYRILMDVLSGSRPSRPTNAEIIGFNEDIWSLMEACWNGKPNERPPCADVLAVVTSSRTAETVLKSSIAKRPEDRGSATTGADFARAFVHALASDFADGGIPAIFAPSHPCPWSSAPVQLAPEADLPTDLTTLSINSSGDLLAVVARHAVLIYDTASLRLLHTLKGHAGRITKVAWSPTDPQILVSGSSSVSYDNESLVRYWDLRETQHELHNAATEHAVERAVETILDALPDEGSPRTDATEKEEVRFLSQELLKTILTLSTRRAVHHGHALAGQLASFGSYPFDQNGSCILYVKDRKSLHVYDLLFHRDKLALTGHTDAIMWAGVSPKDGTIASSSWDRTVRLWDGKSGAMLHVLTGSNGQNWGGAFSKDGQFVAAGSGDKFVRMWSVTSGQLVQQFSGFSGWVRYLSFGAAVTGSGRAGMRLAAAAEGRHGGTVRVFDVLTGELVTHWQIATEHDLATWTEISDIRYSPDGRQLAFKGPDGRLLVYEAETGTKWEFVDDGEKRLVWREGSFAFSPGGSEVWSLDGDGIIRKWDLNI